MLFIECDTERKWVIAHLTGGFLTADDVNDFWKKEQAAVRAKGWRSGEFRLLLLSQGQVVQSQEVIAAMSKFITEAQFKAAKIAVVRGNVITKIQVKRVLNLRGNTAAFTDREEAERWLAEPPEPVEGAQAA